MPVSRSFDFQRSLRVRSLRVALFVVAITVAVILTASPATSNAAGTKPIVLPHDEINMGAANTVAVSDDGRRVYLGKWYSYDAKRLNLVVLTVDENGKVVGAPRQYRDTELPLQTKSPTHAAVTAILPDNARRKLYLSYTLTSGQDPNETRLLSVYDLDENGDPVGKPRTYEAGNPQKSILALARNPKANVLYMTGWGLAAVIAQKLDDKGEPVGEPKSFPVGGQGKYEIAVSPDGRKLYLGTYPDTLEILNLDAEGMPAGELRSFQVGKEGNYLRFAYTPRALYLRRMTEDGARLGVWRLGQDGYPVEDAPVVRDDLSVTALAVDEKRNRLWLAADATFKDAFSGKTIVEGVAPTAVPINPDGTIATPGIAHATRLRQTGVAMAMGAGGVPALVTSTLPRGVLGNRFKDLRVRVTLVKAEPQDAASAKPEKIHTAVSVNNKRFIIGDLQIGKPSQWVDLNDALRDQIGPLLGSVTIHNVPAPRLQAKIEVAQTDLEDAGTPLKTLTDEVLGDSILFYLPGYGYEPLGERLSAVLLFSDHAKKYLEWARKVAIPKNERPRQFITSSYQIMGGQGHLEQLKNSAETVSSLGFNTANVYSWGNIPPKQIDEILDSHGIERRGLAVYNPPSYFDFDKDLMSPAALDKWAEGQAKVIGPLNGGTIADVQEFYLADEPGWYYPTMIGEVSKNAKYLQEFRTYLKSKNLTPEDLGHDEWSNVFPIGRSQATDLPSRRLFYWTMRFFPQSASRGHKLAREALERAFKHTLVSPVNWNNFINQWYTASPNKKIANNPIANPDSAMGSFDWLESGRISAHTLWSEDWFGDQSSQHWSLYSDMLRSGAMLGNQVFGSYVIGGTVGAHEAGGRYRIMSLVGHGAKTLGFFTWGPEPLFPGNCWSESFTAYDRLSSGLRMVGRAERVLFPGKPARGKVAIYVPGASPLWEEDQHHPHYNHEMWSLHHALVHAGYTIDFVDDTDTASGELAKRGYTTLYILGPNIARDAQPKIAEWVKSGGTLVAMPGAGVADEFNTPTMLLDGVLGITSRKAVREAVSNTPVAELPITDTLTIGNAKIGSGSLELRGPIAEIKPKGAAVMAKLKNGGAGITAAMYGKGRAIAYGFFPGWQYWITPDRTKGHRLPLNWGKLQRQVAVAPVRIANTPKAVTLGQEVVEACRLQSDKGIAVVLLNWTDEPIQNLSVTIPRVGKFKKVTSLESGAMKSTPAGDGLKITLPLKNVDVLIIE